MQALIFMAMLSAAFAAPVSEPVEPLPPMIAPPERPLPQKPLTSEQLELGRQLANLIVVSEITQDVVHTPPPERSVGNARLVARPTARWNVGAAAAATYARLYSVEEMRAMIAFFDSPAGQRYLSARRQGVMNVMTVFQKLPWYPDLYNELCGGQDFCRWKPKP
jgi:hypothetical protein